jgi:hypothetical protein
MSRDGWGELQTENEPGMDAMDGKLGALVDSVLDVSAAGLDCYGS